MKKAYIYPGQGAQAIGMGQSVVNEFSEAAELFDKASDIAGYDMRALCAEGPMEKLSQTQFTQPALFTVEASITEVLKKRGITADCTAGHSLGELAAWYAAGVYSFEDGFKLVSARGRIMNNADPDDVGTMSAIIGLDQDTVQEVCESIEGTVVIANINSPAQMVISGERSAVELAGVKLKEIGAKRVLPLAVSGAFHSPLMEAAREELAGIVESIDLKDASIPVYCNVTAEPVTKADEIRKLMIKQLVSPVRWVDTVVNMVKNGVDTAYEIGSGNVLAGLIRRIEPELDVISVSDAEKIMGVSNEKI